MNVKNKEYQKFSPLGTVASGMLLLLLAVVVFCFAYYNFWNVDDLSYQHIIGEWIPAKSLRDIAVSQYNHFFLWNGRVVAHIIVQLFCVMWGKTAFAVFAAIVYVLYIAVIAKAGGTSWRNPYAVFTIVPLALISFVEKFVPSTFVGYFVAYAASLYWLSVFLEKPKDYKWWQMVLLVLLSFLAGNGQESINFGLAFGAFTYLVHNWKDITKEQKVMFVAFSLGALFIAMSPASRGRVGWRVPCWKVTLFNELIYMRATYVLIAVVLYRKIVKKVSFRSFYRDNYVFVNTSLMVFVLLLLVAWVGVRTMFCIELMSIVMLVRILPRHGFNKWGCGVLMVIAIALYTFFAHCMQYRKQCLEDIIDLYGKSPDGTVYYDLDYLAYWPTESMTLKVMYVLSFEEINELLTRKKYGEKGYLRVLPKALENIDTVDMKTQVVPLSKKGPWVMIESKTDSVRHFELTSAVGIGPMCLSKKTNRYYSEWGLQLVDNSHYKASLVFDSSYPYLEYLDIKAVE